jgi:hypothetical protein
MSKTAGCELFYTDNLNHAEHNGLLNCLISKCLSICVEAMRRILLFCNVL